MNKKGITIIELLIVIALVGVVLSLIFSQFIFGYFTFSQGEAHSQIQYELRMAGAEISKLVRNAEFIEITNSKDDNNFEYLWISEGFLYHKKSGVERKITSKIMDNINSSFSFPYKSRYFFRFVLAAQLDNPGEIQSFEVESMVLLNNITDEPPVEVGGTIVKFKNPD